MLLNLTARLAQFNFWLLARLLACRLAQRVVNDDVTVDVRSTDDVGWLLHVRVVHILTHALVAFIRVDTVIWHGLMVNHLTCAQSLVCRVL